MSDIILLGSDPFDLGLRLEAASFEVSKLDGYPTGVDLETVGITDALVLLVTDVKLASLIPVAREQNETIQVVLYTDDRLPPFASAQADLAVDPELVDPDEFVEAVIDRIQSVTSPHESN